MRALIAVDWGTSSLRGARLDARGDVLEERSFERGILTVPSGGFPAVFEQSFGDWMREPGAVCLISGMAGSQQGWVQAPYCACPAGLDDVAAQLQWVVPQRIAIVPGLQCEHDGVPDVMRGEETQVFGALGVLGLSDALVVLPGTHSKWVSVRGGRIHAFTTTMTGEVYGLLRRHSILARSMPADDKDDSDGWHADAFDAGVAHALRSPGLLQAAFSVRTLALFERLAAEHRGSYLSGVVIGEELRSQSRSHALGGASEVVLVGADALLLRYGRAFEQFGCTVRTVGARAAWQGLFEIAGRTA